MNLYVIRHGQTDANFNHIIAGVTDVLINENGKKQAKQASKILKNIDYDVVFCSPLSRTKMTCEIVNIKNKNVIYDERLRERNAGIYEGKKASVINLDEYWNYNLKKEYKNAESIDELFVRVNNFLDMLKAEYSDKNVLLVTHDGVCRTIACILNDIPKSGNMREYSQTNCEIKMYEIK